MLLYHSQATALCRWGLWYFRGKIYG